MLGVATSVLAACGTDGGSKAPPQGAAGAGGGPSALGLPAGGVRRLLRGQYLRSVEYLFGEGAVDAARAAGSFPEDNRLSGYAAIGAAQVPPALDAPASWDRLAERIADAVVADPTTVAAHVPCIEDDQDDSCYEALAEGLGRLAFRRPVLPEEKDWIVGLASEGRALDGEFSTGLKYAVWGIASSPNFLYIVEAGQPDPDRPGWNALTGYELVTRLSFFLTNTTPDSALLDAAEAGAFDAPAGIADAARSLLEREVARDGVWDLLRDSLDVDRVLSVPKDAGIFPDFGPTLREAMVEELRRSIEEVVWTRNGDFRDLYRGTATFVNSQLASHYGLTGPAEGWEKVEFPSAQGRSGLVTSAAILTGTAHAQTTSPTLRGRWVRERLLCLTTPPPEPEDHPALPETAESTVTTRQRVAELTDDPTCRECHDELDPLGFALEHFDAIGRYRATEHDLAIDATGAIPSLGSWDGASELVEQLLEGDLVARCFVLHLLRAGLGHLESSGEEQAIEELTQSFVEDDHRLRALLVTVATSPLFRYVATPEE